MFEIIKNFLSDIEQSEEPEKIVHSRKQVAEAALMYHVIAVDGVVREEESRRMAEVLAVHFGLTEAETADLAVEARNAEFEAIDLYQFTSVLNRSFSVEERASIIENLWEMVFADGVVHELEDNVVWRIAELLHVDSRDRLEIKKRVWKRLGKEQDQNEVEG